MVSFPKISIKRFCLVGTRVVVGGGLAAGFGLGIYRRIEKGDSQFYKEVDLEAFWQRMSERHHSEKGKIKRVIHRCNARLLETQVTSIFASGFLEMFHFCFGSLTDRTKKEFLTLYPQKCAEVFEVLFTKNNHSRIAQYLGMMSTAHRKQLYHALLKGEKFPLLFRCLDISGDATDWIFQDPQKCAEVFEVLFAKNNHPRMKQYLEMMSVTHRKQLYHALLKGEKFPLLFRCLDISGDSTDWIFQDEKMEPLEDLSERYPNLCCYARDLTREISLGRPLNPFFGQEEKIAALGSALNQRLKTFPVLVGDPGVGKTSLIDEIARKVVLGESVPARFRGKRIFILDRERLEAGTDYGDKAVQRLMGLVSEINRRNSEVIVFIDEAHAFFKEYGNILKPDLAAGTLKGIGATTPQEYDRMIAEDGALKRRLPVTSYEEPSPASTLGMLRALRPQLEAKYQVTIEDGALIEAVNLAEKHMRSRRFPDKAIDLLDKACSHLASSLDMGYLVVADKQKELIGIGEKIREKELKGVDLRDPELVSLKEREELCADELRELEEKRQQIGPIIDQIFAMDKKILIYRRLLSMKRGEAHFQEEIDRLRLEIERLQRENGLNFVVTASAIQSVAAEITGLPLDRLSVDEKVRLTGMADRLKESIIAQDEVVDTLCQGIIRARLKLSHPERPKGVFFFMGRTGVGKSELARRLAEDLFGSTNAAARFDMTEYQHSNDITKLIGSPPGYQANQQGGDLTNRLLEKPHSIIILDEFEKAHPAVARLFYQAFDAGRLTDGKGVTVNCQDAIFIMTSNLGSDSCNSGASSSSSSRYAGLSPEQILGTHFDDAFVGRIDEICAFNPLSPDTISKICALRLEEYAQRVLGSQRVTIKWSDEVFDYLAKHGWSEELGARPLERLIDRALGNPISLALLQGSLKEKMVANFTLGDGLIQMECSDDEE